jgi:tripartite-type tricarboxylate transporter receptor subunit TctC
MQSAGMDCDEPTSEQFTEERHVKSSDSTTGAIMHIQKTLSPFMLALLIHCVPGPGLAQDHSSYPNRPIRVIAPVGPGAGVDTAARVSAEAVEKHLGQRLVIENKPGAGLRIGTALAAKATPDGYTLLFAPPTPIAVVEHFPQKIDYDPVNDFRPVAIAVYQPALFIVRPSLGFKTVAEFVAHAKANPGKISFGIQGLGGEMHLMVEVFKKTAGVNLTLVPYQVATQAIVDLLADRLDAMLLVIPPIKGHLDSGQLQALATLNATRVSQYPTIPTMREIGMPEMTNAIWFGYLAPARTPQSIIDKLAGAFAKLQSDAALTKRVSEMGSQLNIVGPAEFAKIIEDDRRRYGRIVVEGNLAQQN